MRPVPARFVGGMLADRSAVPADSEIVHEVGVTGFDFSSVDILLALLSVTLLLVFIASLICWIVLWARGRRFFGQQALVPLRSRRRPFWNAFDFIVFYGVLLVVSIPLSILLHAFGWMDVRPDDAAVDQPLSVAALLINAAGMLLAMLGTIGLLRLRKPDVLGRLGFTRQSGGMLLGVKAAVLILPPTMLLMAAVSVFQEYSHPVLDTLKSSDTDSTRRMAVFAALFFTTAVVAPLVEEFWFRGLLQGGLQRLADQFSRRSSSTELNSNPAAIADEGVTVLQHTTTGQLVLKDGEEPSSAERSPRADDAEGFDWTPHAVWPMAVASLVFALMHWGQGLAPIPLFLLSMGLGYLYRQTGSLIPPITVHFLLNAFTMTATFLEMLRGTGS